MVRLSLFEISLKNQALRTLLALALIIPCDVLYVYLSEGSITKFKTRLLDNKLAYFNVWITLAVVFAVSTLSMNTEETNEDHYEINNYASYGLLIGLLVYVPLYNWIISCGAITNFTHLLSLANTAFGVVLSSIVCLLVFLISEKTNLLT